MKRENGITLIVLVVTIVVLLIISGVAISVIKDDGLFSEVGKTSENATKDEERKVIRLAYTEMQMNKGIKYSNELTIGMNKESLGVFLQKYANDNSIKVEEATESDKENLETVIKVKNQDNSNKNISTIKITFNSTNNSYIVEIDLNENSGGNSSEDPGTNPGGGKETVLEYEVTYNENGGVKKVQTPTYIKKSNEKIELLFNIDEYIYRNGYNFKGWSENATDTEPLYVNDEENKYYTKNENKELYAVWKDEEAPIITILNIKSDSIEFKVTDEGSGVYSYILKDSATVPTASDFQKKETEGQKEVKDSITGLKQETTYYIFAMDVAGNISKVASVTTLKVPDKTNISLSGSPSTWTNKNVTVTATVKQEILNNGYTIQMSLDGTNYENKSSIERTKNGLVYARLIDKSGNVGSDATYNVNNIDKDEPTASVTASVSSIIATSATINSITAADTGGSGISKVVWYYKNSKDSSYTYLDQQAGNSSNSVSVSSKSLNLEDSKTYNILVEVYDVAGNRGTATTTITTKPAIAEYASVKYTSITNAISKVSGTGTVTMLKNTTENFSVPSNKSITLNLNNKTVTVGSGTISNAGTLTVNGNGSIVGVSVGNHAVSNSGKLNLQNAKIVSNTRGAIYNIGIFNMAATGTVEYYGSDTNWAAVDSRGTSNILNIKGGTIKATGSGRAIFMENGSGQHYIANATITGNAGWAIYAVSGAKATIEKCNISGPYGIYQQYYSGNISLGNANTGYAGAEQLYVYNCSISDSSKIRGHVIETFGIGNGGYQVRFYDAKDSTPSAKFYTWTSNNGQDDMTTYMGSKYTLHDSVAFCCNAYKSQHNNESGLYYTHIYTEDQNSSGGGAGTYYFVGGISYTL